MYVPTNIHYLKCREAPVTLLGPMFIFWQQRVAWVKVQRTETRVSRSFHPGYKNI